MRRLLGVALLLFAATGCTDSIALMARDQRNFNNEAVDAVMMVTTDAQAKVAMDRVLMYYPDRLKVIDDRLKAWEFRDAKEKAVDLFSTDSLAVLFAENKANLSRLALERQRLEEVRKQLGDAPNITDLLKSDKLKAVQDNLEKGGGLRAAAERYVTDQKLAGAYKAQVEAFNGRMALFAVDGAPPDLLGGGKAKGR